MDKENYIDPVAEIDGADEEEDQVPDFDGNDEDEENN